MRTRGVELHLPSDPAAADLAEAPMGVARDGEAPLAPKQVGGEGSQSRFVCQKEELLYLLLPILILRRFSTLHYPFQLLTLRLKHFFRDLCRRYWRAINFVAGTQFTHANVAIPNGIAMILQA